MTDSHSEFTKSYITISKREWGLVWLTIILVLMITSVPYIFAYLSTPADKHFMGIMMNVPDHAQYFAWMRGLSENLFIPNQLTPERNAPIFHNLLWWLLGQTGRLINWNYAAMFQVLRVISTIALFLSSYHLISWFLSKKLSRWTAFILMIFSSGFGWMLIVAKYLFHISDMPLEASLLIYIVEPNTFFSILTTPHLVAATLYIVVFDLVLRGEAEKKYRYAVAAGLFALFLGWQHAYDIFLMYSILGAYALLKIIRDKKIPSYIVWSGIIIGLLSFWPGLYSFLLTSLDPIWKAVLAQYDNAGVFSPKPYLIWILMGMTFFMSLYTLIIKRFWMLKIHDDKTIFLIAWFWMNFLLIYIPTDFQIKMLNGWQIPMAILATIGLLEYLLPTISGWLENRKIYIKPNVIRMLIPISFILFVSLTNMYLFAWRFLDLSRHSYSYYLTQDEVQALTCLDSLGNNNQAVLASLTIGQYVPAFTGKYTFVAHWAQTVDYPDKLAWSQEFFDKNIDDDWRQALLSDYQIDYVFYGPVEQEIGEFNPNKANYLNLTQCHNDTVKVFQVIK